MKPCRFNRFCFCLFLPLLIITELGAQDLDKDSFARVFFGFSGGYYNSFLDNFEGKNNKEPLYSASLGIELLNRRGGDHGLYASFQYQFFNAVEEGPQLIRWNQRYFNAGLRYKFIVPFMERPIAILWVGTGLSAKKLSRTDVKVVDRIVFDENNEPQKIEIDMSITDKWRADGFYFEFGQFIPFEASLFPKSGFMWNFKYDNGKNGDLNLGSVSLNFGLYLSLFY